MHEWSSRDTWKHRGRDGYISEEYDDLYLEMLRAEQIEVKNDYGGNVSPIKKTTVMKSIGAILTTPYACLRTGFRTVFGKIGKHPHP